MSDSGYQISNSRVDFFRVYRSMVDRSLGRPAQADINAAFQVTGNNVNVQADITNLSPVPLSSVYNAFVHVMIAENRKVLKTGTFVHFHQAKTWGSETPVGESKLFQFTFSNVRLNWSRSFIVVTVDYMPPGTNVFDALQAAQAVEGQLPTNTPEATDTEVPTETPTEEPTEEPTDVPTEEPTDKPTEEPTEDPTAGPEDYTVYLPIVLKGYDFERPEPPEAGG